MAANVHVARRRAMTAIENCVRYLTRTDDAAIKRLFTVLIKSG
jgi:hypothetical protein